MTLHIFNPSHDEALAANSPYYYPSDRARRLECDWSLLPTIWAGSGDAVLMGREFKGKGEKEPLPFSLETYVRTDLRLVSEKELNASFWEDITQIEPWGWDLLLRHRLRKAGAPSRLLPTDEWLRDYRLLSSRETTTKVLPRIRKALFERGFESVGESLLVHSREIVESLSGQWQGAMAKGLWSCSGRGVFPYSSGANASVKGRLDKLLREQGAVEIEPLYNRALDFALEFENRPEGMFFLGYSLFDTHPSGGYVANKPAPQQVLKSRIEEALGSASLLALLPEVTGTILHDYIGNKYRGLLGIDMMMVRQEGRLLLHPCVEVNLRRTMGHVCLELGK